MAEAGPVRTRGECLSPPAANWALWHRRYLGALGFKDLHRGSRYDWVLPNVAPLLLPWLALAALMADKAQSLRGGVVDRAAAWAAWPRSAWRRRTSFADDLDFCWMWSPRWGWAWRRSGCWQIISGGKHWLLTFLCVVLTMAAFTPGLCLAAGLEYPNETKPAAFALAMGARRSAQWFWPWWGWICRKRYRPAWIYVWVLGLLAVLWTLCAAPFYLNDVLGSSQQIDLSEFFTPVLTVGAVPFRGDAAVFDPVVGQPVLRRTAEGAAARQRGVGGREAARAGGQFESLNFVNNKERRGYEIVQINDSGRNGVGRQRTGEPEQWLQYHTGSEGQAYHQLEATTNPPAGWRCPS